MKFTKKALFMASLALGAAFTASAETYVFDGTDNGAMTTVDYLFHSGDDVTFEVTTTQTLMGKLLGSGINTFSTSLVSSYETLAGTNLTITGGGTLRYEGFNDINYYHTTYAFTSTSSSQYVHNQIQENITALLVSESSNSMMVDSDNTAYSGDLTITGGTTLEVYGFLTQYVGYWSSSLTEESAWVGVQSVTLDENSVISFKTSLENFNFLKDVHASSNSVIEIGIDSNKTSSSGITQYSPAQLVIYTSENTESNIGILRGAGTVYFLNEGTVSFGAQAQFSTSVAASGDYYSGTAPNNFDTQAWLDYIHSYTQLYDTTGETKTGALADVYLSGGTFKIGLNEDGEVVDNIFVSVTGLSFGMASVNGAYAHTVSEILDDTYTPHGGTYSTSFSKGQFAAVARPTWTPRSGSAGTLEIYGTQIINNFQSLFSYFDTTSQHGDVYSRYQMYLERGELNSALDFLYRGATGGSVVLQPDAVLVLNQDKYRDGYFVGKFLAADAGSDNVIIKTGEGNFVSIGYNFTDDEIRIARYYILEGGWYTCAEATGTSKVVIGESGKLVFMQNSALAFTGHVAAEFGAILKIARDSSEKVYDSEQGWYDSSAIKMGSEVNGSYLGAYYEVQESGAWVSNSEFHSHYGVNGHFEVLYTQDEFYGDIELGVGMELILGSDKAENYANAFVNAGKIILCGEADTSARDNHTTITIGSQNNDSAVQLMSLYYRTYTTDDDGNGITTDTAGIGNYNRVVLNNWATLAWNVSESAEVKNLTGTAGALVKLNAGTLSVNESVGYQGATSVLNGTLNLTVQNALGDSAGLILAGTGNKLVDGLPTGTYGSVIANSDQIFGALVGGSGAYITADHATITVGEKNKTWVDENGDPINNIDGSLANFYLATYNGTDKYFEGGLNLMEGAGLNALTQDEFDSLFGDLGTNRPSFNGSEITVDKTNEYVADPALLKRTFARAYAVIDTSTWNRVKSAFTSEDVTLHDYFYSMFTEDAIDAFVKSNTTWSSRQLEILESFAKEFIETNGESVLEKEGTSYNLTVESFSTMKDCYALKYLLEVVPGLADTVSQYLEDNMPSNLDSSASEASLYNFICALITDGKDYEFCFTKSNISTLSTKYGIDVSGNSLAERQESFNNAVGVPLDKNDTYGSSAYAGKIVGTGTQLVKTGTESLILTGENRYGGNTIVEQGELRINYNSIAKSPIITINKGALLTIVSKDNIVVTDGEGNVLTTAAQFGAVGDSGNKLIRGAGTLLKDGAGTLEIVTALAKDVDEADDFTGAIIVGKDTLQIDITTREVLKSDLYINEGATLRFDLQGVTDEETEEFTASDLTLTGTIRGNGTLEFTGETGSEVVFADGDSIAAGTGENSVALQFSGISATIVLDGIVGSGDSAIDNNLFREDANFNIKENTTLTIQVASLEGELTDTATTGAALEYTYDGAITCAGTFVVAGTGDAAAGTGRTLILTNSGKTVTAADGKQTTETLLKISGELQVTSQAILKLDAGALMSAGTVILADGEKAVLWVDGDLTATSILIGDTNKLASTSPTNGKITTNSLTIKGANVGDGSDNFAGTLKLTGADAKLDFDTPDDESTEAVEQLNFNASIEKSGFTLTKTGAGTVVFKDSGDDTLYFTNATVKIEAGTLEMWQVTLAADDKGYAFGAVELGNDAKLIIHGDTTGTEKIKILKKLGLSTGTSMLEIDGGTLVYESGSAYLGSINLINDAIMEVDETVTRMNAVGGTGTITITRDDCGDDLTLVANGDVTFTGTIEFSIDPDLNLTGTGIWSIASYDEKTGEVAWASFENTKNINVGDGLLSTGGIGIATTGTAEGVNIILNEGATVAIVDEISSDTEIEQKLDVADSVKNLTLRANGTLDLSAQSIVEDILNLGDSAGIKFTVSNFNGNLEISGISSENAELKSLSTYGTTGALILKSGEFDGNIGGNGNVTIDGTVTLSSEKHNFTGTLTVASNAALTLDGNVTFASKNIEIKPGATLSGGLETEGKVTFGTETTAALYTASVAAENKITAGTIAGTVTVQLIADSTDRGFGYKLFNGDVSGLTILNPVVMGTGSPLMVIRTENQIEVYVAQNDLREISSFHEGIGSLVSVLSDFALPDENGLLTGTAEQQYIGQKLNMTSAGDLDNAVELLSPLAYASMVAMPAANFANDQRTISQRLEQRLSDNTSKAAVWEYNADWEFFAQAQASTTDAGTDHDSMVFDFDTFGVIAGTDRKFSHEFTAGFAVAYDHGKADIHHSGGKIEADDLRVIGFTGLMINDSIAVNLGAEIGFASYDIKRRNGIGNCKDDTTGFHGGLFAEVLTAIPLIEFIDGERIDLLPHAGLALGYYNVGSASESGLGGLDVDRFDALSLQARVGAELAASFTVLEYNTRATFDISLVHEFLDDEVEIDAKIAGRSFSTDARAMSQTSLSLAPGVMVDLDPKTSVYLNYEFRAGTESIMTHSVNVGFRHRF